MKLVSFLIWWESSPRSLMNVFMDFSNPRSKFVLTLNYFKNERFCLSLCLANYSLTHTPLGSHVKVHAAAAASLLLFILSFTQQTRLPSNTLMRDWKKSLLRQTSGPGCLLPLTAPSLIDLPQVFDAGCQRKPFTNLMTVELLHSAKSAERWQSAATAQRSSFSLIHLKWAQRGERHAEMRGVKKRVSVSQKINNW